MGAYSSNFVIENDAPTAVSSYSHPTQPNWITAHAISTELSIAEVERLWLRFQQLGCNGDGLLTLEVLMSPQLSTDAFVRNILKNFKSRNGSVTFESFLRALKWAEVQDSSTKIKAIFHLLNNGNPLNKEIFSRIVRRVYPDDKPEDIQRVTDVFFTQMDTRSKGLIDETQFVQSLMNLPMDMITNLLNFHILPDDMRDRIHRNLPEFSSRDVSRQAGLTPGNRPTITSPQPQLSPSRVPSDALLRDIAEKINRRDWELVANKLGFLTEDVDNIRDIYPGNSYQQVYQLMREWKTKEGVNARADVLEQALREGGMVDASLLLAP